MALLYIDGFDHYANAAQAQSSYRFSLSWLYWLPPPPAPELRSPGRSGSGRYLRWNGWGGIRFLSEDWTSLMGASVRLASLDQFVLAAVVRPRETNPKYQIGLYAAADGSLEVWTMTQTAPYKGTRLAASAPGRLAPNTWRHVEWKCLLDATAGLYAAQLDGAPLFGGTGRTTSDDQPISDLPPYHAFPAGVDIDDLYLANATAPGVVDFLGDRRVVTLAPRSDVLAGWTPSVPGPHAPLVASLAPDDTTFLTGLAPAGTTGPADSFRFPSPEAPSVAAVQVTVRGEIEMGLGFGGVLPLVGSGVGAEIELPAGDFSQATQVWEKDAAGAPWTSASIAATAFGVRAVSDDSGV